MVAFPSLDALPFFRTLDPAERELLAPLARRRCAAAGSVLFEEGGPARALGVLVDGLIALRRASERGGAVCLGAVREPGAVFGWSALASRRDTYPHSAVCLEESDVVEIDGEGLLALFERHPALGVRLLRILSAEMAERLHGAREQIGSRLHAGLITHG